MKPSTQVERTMLLPVRVHCVRVREFGQQWLMIVDSRDDEVAFVAYPRPVDPWHSRAYSDAQAIVAALNATVPRA